jgi:small-conductance mechanosensitive channel
MYRLLLYVRMSEWMCVWMDRRERNRRYMYSIESDECAKGKKGFLIVFNLTFILLFILIRLILLFCHLSLPLLWIWQDDGIESSSIRWKNCMSWWFKWVATWMKRYQKAFKVLREKHFMPKVHGHTQKWNFPICRDAIHNGAQESSWETIFLFFLFQL